VFADQRSVKQAFERGELERDVVVVVRFQGPRANGMPELHQLTPLLTVLQKKGRRVALVTDGRMSGASGQVPAAIHVSPEAEGGGPIAKLRDGDVLRLDAQAGTLDVLVGANEWNAREAATADLSANGAGMGRELFAVFRNIAASADAGGGVFNMRA
jgi:phosphogluconate dehydratase